MRTGNRSHVDKIPLMTFLLNKPLRGGKLRLATNPGFCTAGSKTKSFELISAEIMLPCGGSVECFETDCVKVVSSGPDLMP